MHHLAIGGELKEIPHVVSTNSPISSVDKSKNSGCRLQLRTMEALLPRSAHSGTLAAARSEARAAASLRDRLGAGRDRLGAGEREHTWLLSISGPDCSSEMSSQWAHTIPRVPPKRHREWRRSLGNKTHGKPEVPVSNGPYVSLARIKDSSVHRYPQTSTLSLSAQPGSLAPHPIRLTKQAGEPYRRPKTSWSGLPSHVPKSVGQ